MDFGKYHVAKNDPPSANPERIPITLIAPRVFGSARNHTLVSLVHDPPCVRSRPTKQAVPRHEFVVRCA